jgi:hypothetical protein
MGDAAGSGGNDVDGTHHACRKLCQDGCLKPGDGVESRMIGRARRKVDARTPRLVQSVCGRVDHAWE